MFITVQSKTAFTCKSQMDHNEICKELIVDTPNDEESLTQND